MRFRPSAGKLLASLLWALPGVVALPTVALAQAAPQSALITAVRGNTLTLAIGTADGAKIGQTFRISRGNVSAKLQITATSAAESTASVISNDPGIIITVGESAAYLGEEPLAAPVPAPPAPNPVTPTPVTPAAPPQTATPANGTGPDKALITAVAGKTVTLGIGSADGAVLGAVYALPLSGDIKARMQITTVRPNDSLASVTILSEGFTPTVGDTTRFVSVEAVELPAPTAPVVTPTVPVTPDASPANPVVTTPPVSPVSGSTSTVEAAPISALTGSTATVTALDGQNVVISAGSAQGAHPALNLPILRGGQIIGLLRLQVVKENTSTGTVLWRDESLAAISPGDAVGILGAPPSVGSPSIGQPIVVDKVPATLVKYETGASNEAVPKADRTYELLASLASNGLITSQRASVFQDDGARRHSTQEDIIFSKAQIAGFIREAISNYDDSKSSRNKAALSILTTDFKRDLLKIGETESSLAPFRDGFSFGVSGFSRYTLAGGNTDASARDPFEDSYGARRSKTGYDSRTNIFGKASSRLSFYGSFDYGNDIRNGNSNILDIASTPLNQPLGDTLSNVQVRKAYLSYDASNLLRGLTVDLGRKEFWWGPGQFGTSVLGDSAGGLNSLSTRFERGSYRLEGMYSYLGRGPSGGFRSLYGQNLSVKVGQQTRIGATTVILSPKDKFDPKLFLGGFTPISLYLVDRQGNQDRTNAVVGGYVETAVGKGARVYGEITLDDLSVNENNSIENRAGSVVGVQLFNPKDPSKAGIRAEFARFNSLSYLAYVGNVRDSDYFYQNRDSPLGYPVSPAFPTVSGGSESLRFETYYKPTKRLRLTAGLEFADVNAEDQNLVRIPGAGITRGFTRQQTYRFAAAYDLSRSFTLTARSQRVDSDQPNFLFGEPAQKDKYFSIEIARSF